MGGVLPTHQPAGEEGESCLHEEHQVSCDESPVEVGRNPDMPDAVGQLDRERLFFCLGLVFVELLFLLRIFRVLRVGWLSNDKRITGPSRTSALVPVAIPEGSGFGSSAKAGCMISIQAMSIETERSTRAVLPLAICYSPLRQMIMFLNL